MAETKRPGGGGRDLEDLRRRIDAIDDEIARLLNRRAVAVMEIGDWKQETGHPVYDPRREGEIIDRLAGGNGGPLPDGALRRLFERIIDESRSLERSSRSGPDRERRKKRGG